MKMNYHDYLHHDDIIILRSLNSITVVIIKVNVIEAYNIVNY